MFVRDEDYNVLFPIGLVAIWLGGLWLGGEVLFTGVGLMLAWLIMMFKDNSY